MVVSIVIPAYNEEESLPHLYQELKPVLGKGDEIVFVDDGSTDSTFAVAEKLAKQDSRVKVIRFKRNFGKAAALSAGFHFAKGDEIVTMDADLQDDPQEIPKLLEELRKEKDLIVGWKRDRKDPSGRKFNSGVFNGLVRALTGVDVHDSDCNFRAMKSQVAQSLNLYAGMYRYIPSLAQSKGFRVGEVPVNHRKRRFGKSKYGASRLFNGFFDVITMKFLLTFDRRPMHLFAIPGVVFTALGLLVGCYLTFLRFAENAKIGDRPLLMLAVLLVVLGIQFLSLGLLGEMISSRNSEKSYVIQETRNEK